MEVENPTIFSQFNKYDDLSDSLREEKSDNVHSNNSVTNN